MDNHPKTEDRHMDEKTLNISQTNIKQISFADKRDIGILLAIDAILVIDISTPQILHTIRKDTYPRSAQISKCGRFMVAYYMDNNLYVMNPQNGKVIQTIIEIPPMTRNFLFSGDSAKLIYGNTQTIVLWRIRESALEIISQNWKNINCFAINHDGTQFALGTYNGTIYVLTIVDENRCKQLEMKRQKTCVTSIAFCGNQIISVSYDKRILIATIECDGNDRMITYQEKQLSEAPRCIHVVGERFFLIDHKGISWFDNQKQNLIGLKDRHTYTVIRNEDKDIVLFKMERGMLCWWPIIKFVREEIKQQLIKIEENGEVKYFRYAIKK